MYKVTYLKDTVYFNSFDELKHYFWKNADSLDELVEALKKEYDGMEIPKIEVV